MATFLTLLKKRQLTIVFILISFLLAGILRIGIAFTSKKPDIEIKEATIFTGTIVESSKQIKTISLSSPTPLKGLKTIFRTDENIDIGNSVKVFGNLSEIEPTFSNPYIISWKWLKYIEGIHHEVKGRLISSTSEKNIFQRVRNFFLKKIDQSEAKQAEIIKAITIGDKTSLDDNIKTLFLKTGTSHILAISGLHVGIISGFIFFLIKWLIGRHYVSRLSGRDKKYASLLGKLLGLIEFDV
ncbi:MAG TPA: ComEC/Rec2 family competence protein, partial [Syntrophorhabdaceae bacterium]|nr:ComEC/Rec2 family competence protein [Syntrophorhabdaceae bacterium]